MLTSVSLFAWQRPHGEYWWIPYEIHQSCNRLAVQVCLYIDIFFFFFLSERYADVMVAGWFQVFCPEQWVRSAGVFRQWAVATPETTWDAPIGWGGHLAERRGFTHLHRQCHQRGAVQAQGWVPPTCQHWCNSSVVPSGLNTHPCPPNLLSIDLTAACDGTQESMRRQVVLLQW